MKNVKNLFGMAVMATALVGCSSNDNLNPNANEGAGKAGEAYASFKINLPTTSGTSLKSLIMPSITLGVGIAAVIARFTRSSIIEVLKEDYVRTARAKGIKEKVVIWKHVFRNSMISVVTVVGLQFGFLLGGSVVTETVFAYPGLGSLLIESVNYRDYPAIQSLILIFSLQFIVINLIVDILYAVLNPEIKLQ